MIVLGASRHAKEVLQILRSNEINVDYLFDNFSTSFHSYFDDHDVTIGNFCEISPKVVILGGACVGDLTSIGAGAIVLPDIKVGTNSVIGAGSIVTKDVGDNEIWYGNASKFIKSRI